MLHIISKTDLSIKDIVQVSDYSIEENINLNGKSVFDLSRKPYAEKGDFIQVGGFKGIISNIETKKDTQVHSVHVEEISSLFDRNIILTNSALISSTGLEDFIAQVIHDRWTHSSDTLLNIGYLNVSVSTHTPLNFTVETQDNIFNFRTFLGNMNERYGVSLSYEFVGSQLNIVIAKQTPSSLNIDLTIGDIVGYEEVYSVDVVAKVTVLSKATSTEFNYYLKTDRTITTNASDPDRAIGKVQAVACEEDVDAVQKGIDTFKSNTYAHNIKFAIVSDSRVYDLDELSINRPLQIKTSDNGVYSTFIAKKKSKMKSIVVEFECGNIRVNLIDKLKGAL